MARTRFDFTARGYVVESNPDGSVRIQVSFEDHNGTLLTYTAEDGSRRELEKFLNLDPRQANALREAGVLPRRVCSACGSRLSG